MGGGAATLTPPGFGYLHGCPMDGGRKWGCLPRRHPCDRVCPTAPTCAQIGWQEQDTPRAVPGGCRWVAGPPPLPLPALGISMGAPWMGGASGDAYLAVTLATGCAPPPPPAPRSAGRSRTPPAQCREGVGGWRGRHPYPSRLWVSPWVPYGWGAQVGMPTSPSPLRPGVPHRPHLRPDRLAGAGHPPRSAGRV